MFLESGIFISEKITVKMLFLEINFPLPPDRSLPKFGIFLTMATVLCLDRINYMYTKWGNFILAVISSPPTLQKYKKEIEVY